MKKFIVASIVMCVALAAAMSANAEPVCSPEAAPIAAPAPYSYPGYSYEPWQLQSFGWLSTSYVDYNDIRTLSRTQRRILRNAIYAMHGYIFSSADLRRYFSGLSWYYPSTKNVRLSKIEQYNVNFIKKYE